MILAELGAPLGVDTDQWLAQELFQFGNIVLCANPLDLDVVGQLEVLLHGSGQWLELVVEIQGAILGFIVLNGVQLDLDLRPDVVFDIVPLHDALGLHELLVVRQIFDQVAQHLLEA